MKVEKLGSRFVIKKDEKRLAKEAREARIQERKNTRNKNFTNAEVYEFLCDLATRQEVIYDLVKRGK